MKYSAFISLMLLGFEVAFAQQPKRLHGEVEPDYAHIVKVNVFSPLVGTFNVHVEKALTENSSFQLEGFYFTGQFFSQNVDVRGVGFTANYRYYITRSFPSGWFIQPFLRYQRYWPLRTSSSGEDNAQVGTLGMVFGYQVVSAKRLSLDIFAGPMYSKLLIDGKYVSNEFFPVFNGPWIRFGGTIGFLF